VQLVRGEVLKVEVVTYTRFEPGVRLEKVLHLLKDSPQT
jgi:hypothetical protein